MFIAFVFSIILFFIAPQPGWYFWVIPFLAYLNSKEPEGSRGYLIFYALQITYLIYFYFIFHTEDFVSNILLTTLQTLLAVNCIYIFHKGIRNNRQYKITDHPFILGIAGSSGTGKTTLSNSLVDIFGVHSTSIVRGDDVHKWERNNENWSKITALNPGANYLHRNSHDLLLLKSGKSISRIIYDHNIGRFGEKIKIFPNSLVIFEGLHSFYLTSLREIYDLKIFMEPSINLVKHWKIVRDMNQRGYTKEQVLDMMEKRRLDEYDYILTQSKFADVVIEQASESDIFDIGNANENITLYHKLVIDNSFFVEDLIEKVCNMIDGIKIKHSYIENDKQEIVIHGKCTQYFIKEILLSINEKIGFEFNYELLPCDTFGIVIVFIIHCILEKGGIL
jgi:uridine kinase